MSFYWQQFPEFGACALAVLVGTLKISSCAVGNVAVRSAKQKKAGCAVTHRNHSQETSAKQYELSCHASHWRTKEEVVSRLHSCCLSECFRCGL